MVTPVENLKGIINEIKNNEIMLPDFQRQFDWNIEKQCGLVASVLTRLPVGGILLLKADSKDYKSKRIGLDAKEDLEGNIPDKTNFLLDGQQRMTCLTNVFSDVIHESSKYKISKLASRSYLATRFYLKINRWNADIESGTQKDLFGIRTLDFRFDVSKGEEPDFLTADILDNIECRTFTASEYGNTEYMPKNKYTSELDDYCSATKGFYLIPLFLLVGTDSHDVKLRKGRLLDIIKKMSGDIVSSIKTHHNNLADSEKKIFAMTLITDLSEEEEYDAAEDKDAVFAEIVEGKSEIWQDDFQKYLYSCVESIKLNKIEMPEGSRARAIDIYENMNMGGMSLSTLDLVAARVAKISQESLYDRILKTITSNTKYFGIPNSLKKVVPNHYNASKNIGAVDVRVSKFCTDLFLEVLGLYCNNPEYDSSKAKCNYSKSLYILKLSENDIDDNCEKVCIGIDRAFAFLQMRCGVKNISKVNYKIMIRIISYIFTNDKWYKNIDVHNKIEAWYWAAIFSGEYDKDQNERYEKNLADFLDTFNKKRKDYDWIVNMKNKVLDVPYFSDCEFLLLEKADEGRVPKNHLIEYLCQFYLTKPYSDLVTNSRTLSVFDGEKHEKHHIVPLGSAKKMGEVTEKLRNDKYNILNSPLNFVYISDKTNGYISDKSLKEYEDEITPEAKVSLFISSYPEVGDLDKEDVLKDWMKERHKNICGALRNRIDDLLN